ncbi:hypothetical protein BH10ACT10_BH10ACT10_29550 [soil metagenome]
MRQLSTLADHGGGPHTEGVRGMFLTILVIALVVAFVAVIVWFATNRDGNGSDLRTAT